jgi:dolichyl-phosphate-mannose--protein O-mannosyl transferase
MQLNNKDLLTIAILSIIFLSVATWNLGLMNTPVTSAEFSSGQSFYLDLGTVTDVGLVHLLLHKGTANRDASYNVSVFYGSPENWQIVTSGTSFSDYYKWNSVSINQLTQYIKVDFIEPSNPIIAEAATTNFGGEQIQIVDIVGLSPEMANLDNLIDEQDLVELPATYMTQTYFDEIYFVRTAEQYLHLQSPYEWTHPPLGKHIQAVGIAIAGFSPFGWRIMGVIFAALMIPVIYLLAKKLFGTWIGAFASAFLLTFDFMHFTMGRMGTVDTYVVFFALLSQLCFFFYLSNVLKNGWKTSVIPLFLAVVFFALGFSTKWLVLYSAVGMLTMLIVLRIKEVMKLKEKIGGKYAAFFDHPFMLLLAFIGVAVGIYFLVYVPDMLTGRPLLGTYGEGVIDLQFAMYNYHSTLVATHDFASSWISWPFMFNPIPGLIVDKYVPLWLAITYNLPGDAVSTITAFGNPAVWWVGFVAIFVVTERAIRGKELLVGLKNRLSKKNRLEQAQMSTSTEDSPSKLDTRIPSTDESKESLPETEIPSQSHGRKWDVSAIFIATVFFFSWIPYVFISRITYIYHFYVSVPLLCLASAYLVHKGWNTRAGKIVAIVYFVIVVIMFVVFFPVISGLPTGTSYIHNLKWFPSWFFAP